MTSYEEEVFVTFWGLMGVKTLNSLDMLSLNRFAVKKHGNIGVQKPSTVQSIPNGFQFEKYLSTAEGSRNMMM